jgi:PAS domain S-box-containing protein
MFGYDSNELTGRPISVINAPGDKSPQTTADEIINNLDKTGTWSGEVFNIRKNGTTFWCYATVSKFYHQQYGPVWVSVHMDITERKLAEGALRSREHDFTSLVENAADMIVRFDCDLHYVYCNPAVERQLGIPFYQLRGKTPLEFGTSVEQSRFIDASLRKTLETGIAQEVEQSVSTPSGLRHFQTRIVPEHDPDGSIVSLLAITRDITEHKHDEDDFRQKTYQQLQASYETLQKTEADLRLHQTELEMQNEELRLAQRNLEVSRGRYFELYDLAPAGYLTLSEDGLILNANLTVATMLGVERKQLEKKAVSKYIVKDDQDIFYRCRNDLVKTGERQSCELRMLPAGGSSFRAQVVAVPAKEVEGDEAAISLMVIDIDGRKTAGNGT